MSVTTINKMLAHLLDGIDTEHPGIGDVWMFNNRFVEAVNAMPVGMRFTDGDLTVEKINEKNFRISFPEPYLEHATCNNSDGSNGIGAFWSNMFGELRSEMCDWGVEIDVPVIPNGTLNFRVIEEE